jgi:hypothetical protein
VMYVGSLDPAARCGKPCVLLVFIQIYSIQHR